MRGIALLVALTLCSCAHYEMVQDCRSKAGPEPYAAGHAFGVIGDAIMASEPEHQAWQAQVDTCVRQQTASK